MNGDAAAGPNSTMRVNSSPNDPAAQAPGNNRGPNSGSVAVLNDPVDVIIDKLLR